MIGVFERETVPLPPTLSEPNQRFLSTFFKWKAGEVTDNLFPECFEREIEEMITNFGAWNHDEVIVDHDGDFDSICQVVIHRESDYAQNGQKVRITWQVCEKYLSENDGNMLDEEGEWKVIIRLVPIFDSWGLSIATREPLIGGNLQDYILKDNERIDQAPGTVNDYFNQLMGIFKSSADTRPCPTLEQEVQFDFDRDGCGYTPLSISSTQKEVLVQRLPKNIHELGTTIISAIELHAVLEELVDFHFPIEFSNEDFNYKFLLMADEIDQFEEIMVPDCVTNLDSWLVSKVAGGLRQAALVELVKQESL